MSKEGKIGHLTYINVGTQGALQRGSEPPTAPAVFKDWGSAGQQDDVKNEQDEFTNVINKTKYCSSSQSRGPAETEQILN